MSLIREELADYRILLRNIPSLVISVFIVSVIMMNLLANKEFISTKYLALDCGYALSWVSFLCMDMICKRFGARAAAKVSILAMTVNIVVCIIFWLLSLAPGMWGEYYSTGDIAVNDALNATIGGTWYVVAGSSIAMFCGAITNSFINHSIGKIIEFGGYRAFAMRAFVSTGIGQFVDNMIFSTIVSHHFFGWTWTQVVLCSITAAAMELLCEVVAGPLGYRIIEGWERDKVGEQYMRYKEMRRSS